MPSNFVPSVVRYLLVNKIHTRCYIWVTEIKRLLHVVGAGGVDDTILGRETCYFKMELTDVPYSKIWVGGTRVLPRHLVPSHTFFLRAIDETYNQNASLSTHIVRTEY